MLRINGEVSFFAFLVDIKTNCFFIEVESPLITRVFLIFAVLKLRP